MIRSMKHVLFWARNGWLGLVVLLAFGCAPAEPDPVEAPPNLILVTVDTLRADRLSPYTGAEAVTPEIARLASEGILFENAFTDVSWTVPSVSTFLTGRYPTEHGVRSWHDRLADEETTLPELLHERGYHTAAVVGSFPLTRSFGFAQGFDSYDDRIDNPMGSAGDRDAPERWLEQRIAGWLQWMGAAGDFKGHRDDDEVAGLALAWLAANPERPFFLWIHFLGPHLKNVVYDTLEERIAAYAASVAAVDRQLGRVLAALRGAEFADDTAILFHSDHGESLKEHGLVGHGMDVYDTTARIPMIVKLPGARRAGERVPGLVRNVDVFPTLLELAGIDPPQGVARSLLSEAPADRHAYLETWEPRWLSATDVEVGGETRRVGRVLRGVRTRDWKLIVEEPAPAETGRASTPLPESFVAERRRVRLYDLASDPGERRDVAAARPDKTAALLDLLAEHPDRSPRHERPTLLLDPDARERLRALGYIPPE